MVKIEMRLDQDRFVVGYDASKATAEDLIAVIETAGWTAELIANSPAISPETTSTRIDDLFFIAAVARAKRENKPIVLNFEASWCKPCKRMERETFPDRTVSRLLDRCIFLKIDTDQHVALAKGFGVVGLPDFRFLAPDCSERKRLLGFQDAATFAQALKKFLKDLEQASTKRDGPNTKQASQRTKRSARIEPSKPGKSP